jgi:transcriptional regulator with XRE-family HTH domain
MKTIKKCFGSRIKEIRESKGLNQEQLAEIVNMESRHISRIETGKSFTTLENIDKIAKALNVDINTLFAFQHKKDKNILIAEIDNYLKKADEKQIELAYKLIQAVFI